MLDSSPSSNNPPISAGAPRRDIATPLLVLIGIGALLLTIVVFITGGFFAVVGGLRISVRHWPRPLVIATLIWFVAIVRGRARVSAFLTMVASAIEERVRTIAVVLAAAAAGAGIGFGTYAAAGSDAAGYIGAAQLFAEGHVSFDEPLARQVGWPAADATFAPLGFRPSGPPGRIVPTYPPGLPLAILPARAAFGEFGAFLVVPALGALAVLCTFGLARRMHGPVAGLIAASFLATSPIFLFEITQPMSDVPAAAWWALALWLAWNASPGRAALAGAAAGCALLTRPNLLPLVAPLALVVALSVPLERRSQAIRLVAACAFAVVPFGVVLLFLQQRMYGSPFESGYGAGVWRDFFALANVPQNATAYLHRLLVAERPVLIASAASLLALVVRRRQLAGSRASLRAAAIAMSFVAVTILSYLPYGVFPDWWYLRFLLPAYPAFFATVGVLATVAIDRAPRAAHGVVLVTAITTVGVANVANAQRLDVFLARSSEARYQIAGRYLQAMLPANAVIVTVQDSAAVRVYTHLPVLRWDQLSIDLDVALAQLTDLGHHPLLLVEDWERPQLRAKFPASSAARLDWMPMADFGDPIRVGLFDAANRDTKATDRIH